MTAEARLIWALIFSLVIWLPAAYSMVTDRLDVTQGGLYYLGALALSWFGTGIIANITSGYRRSLDEVERAKRQIELLEKQAAAQQRRRREDRGEESPAPDDDLPPTV